MTFLADRDTPLIRNAWYVLAFSTEVDRTLLSRKIEGEAVVFFRRLDVSTRLTGSRPCNGTKVQDSAKFTWIHTRAGCSCVVH